MSLALVTIDARKPTAEGRFVRYEMTATCNGARYYVAAVHRIGGATTVVDIRKHDTLRRTPSSAAAYRAIHDAAKDAVRTDVDAER